VTQRLGDVGASAASATSAPGTGGVLPTDALASTDEGLVEEAQAGNERSIETLLHRYRHYARAKARTYFLAGADKEDIVQEGMIGLFKAIRDFQGDKNSSFRAFAELCISRQIITAIKTASRQKHLPLNSYVSLSKPVGHEDDSSLGDSIAHLGVADPAELVISAEEFEHIKESLHRLLSNLETEVLHLYMEGKSYQQIADMLGRHVKSIDNALQRIKRKLEEHLSKREAELSP
jgi:RNA polymerase sporulation-specific sigma factor